MPFIVDGIVFVRKRSEHELVLTQRGLGEHVEISTHRPVVCEEMDAPEPILQYWRERLSKPIDAAARRELDRLGAERVARRRRIEARRRCKCIGADTLLTGTYKANQGELGRAWGHWKEFVRRVRRVWPGFVYVVAWERQARGAWHWHCATRGVPRELQAVNGVRVKSYNVLRAIWRSVVGDLGGTVNVARRQRSGAMTQASIARYLSKYMLKSSQTVDAGANLWASSAVAGLVCVVRQRFDGEAVLEALSLAYAVAAQTGNVDERHLAFGDTLYLSAGPPRVDRSIHSAPMH